MRDLGSVTYYAAIESAAQRDVDEAPSEFAQRVEREARRRDFETADRRVALGDGAKWFWNLADEHFPGAIQIVDFFHAKLPDTDSIRELAEFWDTHDVTDFGDQLVEVGERVFARRSATGVTVPLTATALKALRALAARRGVDEAVLVRSWVQEKLHH